MKLKIELFRYKTLVFGSVLEQDESLRDTSAYDKTVLFSKEGFSIMSSGSPSLVYSTLYIRGSMLAEDNRPFENIFPNEKTAIELCEKIKKGVDFINGIDKEESVSEVVRVI